MAGLKRPDDVNVPPFETEELRANLTAFLDAPVQNSSGAMRRYEALGGAASVQVEGEEDG